MLGLGASHKRQPPLLLPLGGSCDEQSSRKIQLHWKPPPSLVCALTVWRPDGLERTWHGDVSRRLGRSDGLHAALRHVAALVAGMVDRSNA